MMTMNASVLQVYGSSLLVFDQASCQQVIVHTPNAACFSAGDCVCIHYNGVMTQSIPPQISATCIYRAGCC